MGKRKTPNKIRIQVYVTPKQMELLSKDAEDYQIKISELIRAMIMEYYSPETKSESSTLENRIRAIATVGSDSVL